MQTRPHHSLVALVVAALVATGCGSDSGREAAPVATAAPTSTPTTAVPPPETSLDPVDTTTPPMTETPTTETAPTTTLDPGQALQRLEFPEELGAGYRRSPEPGTPVDPSAWAAIADRPECAAMRVMWDATMPFIGPLHYVLYYGATPEDLRQVVVWGTDPTVAADLMSFLADDPVAAARCWQEAIRGLGLVDLVITDLGRGEVPEAGAEIVWRRHLWTSMGEEYTRPAAMIRLGSLLALVAFDRDSTDTEIVAILSDIESRLLAASQGT
ncbi:MAG: hypothetical protein HY828_21275 [Actinobacteria bacterium]|nr:hypothetical protein [Actinomycetota bacterium]